MNLEKQIRDARQAIDELTADETELRRLEAEQVTEIEAMKASGSKDFEALATLEAKRAALSSMLAEQRQAISGARDDLARLESALAGQAAEEARQRKLEELRSAALALNTHRQKVDGLLIELGDLLRSHLARITQARQAWETDLVAVQHQAMRDFGLRVRPDEAWPFQAQGERDRGAWRAALAEVGGAAAELLLLSPLPGESQSSGLSRPYSVQENQLAAKVRNAPADVDFDPPVSLTIKAALVDALRNTPDAYLVRQERR